MKIKALQDHLNAWMLVYVVAAIAAGLVAGVQSTTWIGAHQSGVRTLTTLAVFLIIYPMMVNLRLEALLQAGTNIKGLLLATAFNFIWAPIVGLALARVFLPNHLLALGFLLVMVVPCSSMAIGYTGLSKGNMELATVIVALSFLLAVVAVPLWMTLFAGRYQVALPLRDMLWTIAEVLIAPMILGYLTRVGLVRWAGATRFQALQPLFPALSLLAMYGIIFTIFFSKATMIVTHWPMVLLLLVPNGLFIAVTLAAVTWLNRRLGVSYEDNMAVVFASTGKNNGTAIAIATMAFSPLVAVPAATMPIFQILLMVLYLRSAKRIRGWFAARPWRVPPATA
jgi:ACR3 family arsenite efflux pump ArsB